MRVLSKEKKTHLQYVVGSRFSCLASPPSPFVVIFDLAPVLRRVSEHPESPPIHLE